MCLHSSEGHALVRAVLALEGFRRHVRRPLVLRQQLLGGGLEVAVRALPQVVRVVDDLHVTLQVACN